MRGSLYNAFKISMTIIGTTVGAGFASGRELWEFFGSYGADSGLAIVISMILFYSASMILLFISWHYQTRHYSELLDLLMGRRCRNLFDLLVIFYLLSGTIVMLAGSGTIFEQWNHTFMEGCLLLGVAMLILLFFDVEGLLSMNSLLIPILVFMLIYVCTNFLTQPVAFMAKEPVVDSLPAWPSAIAYTALNIISLVAVLPAVGNSIQHQREIWIAGIMSSLILLAIALLYNYCLLRVEYLLSQYEIPLFALVKDLSPFFLFLISLVLWLSIYTTAVSNLYGIVMRAVDWISLPYWMWGLIILLVLTPLSQVGFTTLVRWLYPLYGVLNLFLLAVILLFPLTMHKKRKS